MSFLKRILPTKVYNSLRSALLFRPDDGSDLSQITPRMKTGTKAESIQGFRYPAPGSQPQPKVPLVSNEDQIYDSKFFSRDSRNLPVQDRLTIYASKGPIYIEPVEDKGGSPGSKIPAVLQYDPSGLRASMTSNHAALDAALAKIEPNHLPTEPWMRAGAYEALLKEREDKGLPPPIGTRYKPKYVSENTNTVRW